MTTTAGCSPVDRTCRAARPMTCRRTAWPARCQQIATPTNRLETEMDLHTFKVQVEGTDRRAAMRQLLQLLTASADTAGLPNVGLLMNKQDLELLETV